MFSGRQGVLKVQSKFHQFTLAAYTHFDHRSQAYLDMNLRQFENVPLVGSLRTAYLRQLANTVSPAGILAWSGRIPALRRLLQRPPVSDLRRVKNIGVLRYDGMGDMVLTSGMLRELRRCVPNAKITMICRTPWAAWMRTCPWVDQVLDLEMTFPTRFYEQRRVLQLLRFARREIWPLELDVLLQPGTLYWYFNSRALAWFTGAPVRACWEDPNWGVDTGGGFHTHNLPFPNAWHETDKCYRMLEAVGLNPQGRHLECWWTEQEGSAAAELAHNARNGRRQLVALGLACSEEPRRWPKERFLEVIRAVSRERNVSFMAFGGLDVAETCHWLAGQVPDQVCYLGPKHTLGTLWAAIAQCDLYLGNDTGFTHMAAAARVPVVDIRGLPVGARLGTRGDPCHTGPYDTICRVVRPPAGTPVDAPLDAKLVPVEPVLTATLELLSRSPAKSE